MTKTICRTIMAMAMAALCACDPVRAPIVTGRVSAAPPQGRQTVSGATPNTVTPPAPPPAGNWVTATRQTLYQVIPTLASFLPRQTTKLGSQVPGRVEEVLVDAGDRVKKGQEVARIERTFFEIELSQRKAERETAKVSVTDAKLKLDRYAMLFGDGKTPSISQQELDQARTAHELAAARQHQTEEAVRYAEQRLKETVVRAPYDGVVTQRLVSPGEPINGMFNTPMIEVQDINPIELHFTLPQEYFSRVKVGMPVIFRVEGVEMEGGGGRGLIDMIFPGVDQTTRAIRYRVLVGNPDLTLRPGLLAELGAIEREVKNALAIPRTCVRQSGASSRVTVLENGAPADREVKTGVIFRELVEITDGLKDGDRVLDSRTVEARP